MPSYEIREDGFKINLFYLYDIKKGAAYKLYSIDEMTDLLYFYLLEDKPAPRIYCRIFVNNKIEE